MIDKEKLMQMATTMPLGLYYGRTGLALYLARTDKEAAVSLINTVAHDLQSLQCNTEFRNGLTGIVFGLSLLQSQDIVQNGLNELKDETDALVFRWISTNLEDLQLSEIYGYVFYETWRLSNIPPEDEENVYGHRELTKKLCCTLLKSISPETLVEPYQYSLEYAPAHLLYSLARICKQGIYKLHIEKTLHELSPLFLYKMPVLHSNRLFLLWALCKLLSECIPNEEWEHYKEFLCNNISLGKALKDVSQSIYITDGASSLFFMLRDIDKMLLHWTPSEEQYAKKILSIINNAREISFLENNEAYLRHHLGLYNGYAGVALTKDFIEKTYGKL